MKCVVFTYYFNRVGYFQSPDDLDIVTPDLEPIFEPEPVVFTFDTPAWYVTMALLLIVLIFGIVKWYNSYRSKEYRRLALKKLKAIQLSDSPYAALSTIQITLKQVAIATYGRPEVAALFGTAWLNFLEKTGKHTQFMQFELLLGSNSDASIEHNSTQIGALRDTAKKWIRTHA